MRINGTCSVGIKSEIDKDALDMGFNDIFGDLQSLAAEFEIPDQRKREKMIRTLRQPHLKS